MAIRISIHDFYDHLTLEENYSKLDALREEVKRTKKQVVIRRKLFLEGGITMPIEWRNKEEAELIERRNKQKNRDKTPKYITTGYMRGIEVNPDLNYDVDELPMPTEEQYKKKYIRKLRLVQDYVRNAVKLLNDGYY